MLTEAVTQLSIEAKRIASPISSSEFEKLVCQVLTEIARGRGVAVSPQLNPQGFPDILVNGFGIEVKTVKNDSWLTIGNSIFEGTKDDSAREVFVVFGKFGGVPEVRWARYGQVVSHVRTTHMPRFIINLETDHSLFEQMEVTYEEFCELSIADRLACVKKYSRGRLQPGERLWWIEDEPATPHGLPMQVRLYMRLSTEEKRRLRAEAAILCPKILLGSRVRDKYNDVGMFLLTYYGVFCPQLRDLFSAGSVAGKETGGDYVLRALQDIQPEMRDAASRLASSLFVEYWGFDVPPAQRIQRWLRIADELAPEREVRSTLFLGDL